MLMSQNVQNDVSKDRPTADPSYLYKFKGAFVWDQSGIRIIGIMQVSVRLAALPIPEYLDFQSGNSAPRSRIAGI